jgi:quercetin dioxygenase-like cupin family protein
MKTSFLIFASILTSAAAATRTELVRNAKVIASEEIVRPAEMESSTSEFPSVTVFFSAGTVQTTSAAGQPETRTVKPGDVIYWEPHAGRISAGGSTELHFFRIEFCGPASAAKWGTTGFAPDYKLLVENDHARAYNIRIPAGSSEPRHTHHDRIVVCLSGAQLRHVLDDGSEQDSTLETGQCLWRLGQTHIGKNIGKTDLWVIAIEPK